MSKIYLGLDVHVTSTYMLAVPRRDGHRRLSQDGAPGFQDPGRLHVSCGTRPGQLGLEGIEDVAIGGR